MKQSGVWQFASGSIDNALNAFVIPISSSLASDIAPLVTAGVTIWIIMYGWAMVRGEIQEPVQHFAVRAFEKSVILTLALSAGAYQANILEFVNGISTGLVQAVMNSVTPDTNTNVFSAIDALDIKVASLTQMLFERGDNLMPTGGYADIFAALIIGIAASVAEFLMAGFLLLAKVFMAFVLAVGPIFIACLAFPVTRRFADGWIAKVVNYVLLTVFVSAASAISLSIYQTYVNATIATAASTNSLQDAFGLVALAGALIIVIVQLPSVAAGIAGGAAISGAAAMAFGAMMGRLGAGGGDGNAFEVRPKMGQDGGSISGGGDVATKTSGGTSPRVPAYQRATYDRLLAGKD
jgi:type IV secretion system protein VirB6